MGPGEGTCAEDPEQGSTESTQFSLPLLPVASLCLLSLLAAFQPGGEMYFSDVYASQRLSETARKHRVLWGA